MDLKNVHVSKLIVSWNEGQKIFANYSISSSEYALELGKTIRLEHLGKFACTSCSRDVKKLFDSFCYPCFKNKAQADLCMMSPHLCHYMKGTCREPAWADEYCHKPHSVYVSFTDKFKIGITRDSQIPTRWIDQGATKAAVIANVNTRHQAGMVEKLATQMISDKSHWSNMIKKGNTCPEDSDFEIEAKKIQNFLSSHLSFLDKSLHVTTPTHLHILQKIALVEDLKIFQIVYPINQIPAKIKSRNWDKETLLEGELVGIKGQYLIFSDFVFNMRRHGGYIANLQNY